MQLFVSGARRTGGDRAGTEGPRSVTVAPPTPITPSKRSGPCSHHAVGHGPSSCLLVATAVSFSTSSHRVPASHQRCRLHTTAHTRPLAHVPAVSSCGRCCPTELDKRGVTAFFRVALAVTAAADVELRGAVQTGAAGK